MSCGTCSTSGATARASGPFSASVVYHELNRRLFEEYATGERSLGSLAEEFADLGLTTKRGHRFTDERVKRVLRHPFYAGQVRYRGELREGTHAPIVSRELFERVQAVLRARSDVRGAKGSKFFLLRGLLWCGRCGTRLTAEDHPKGATTAAFPAQTGGGGRARGLVHASVFSLSYRCR